MNNRQYFHSELIAILLTSIILLALLILANFFGLIVINFGELLIYAILTILAGLFVWMIRWYLIFRGKRR